MTAATPKVLVVNDSPLLAAELQQMLAGLGLEAVTLHEPELAPALAVDAAAVFIEIQLLHDNGFQVARRVRAAAGCPVVLLSGSGRATDVEWAVRAGASAVLARPLLLEALHWTLEQIGVLPQASGVP